MDEKVAAEVAYLREKAAHFRKLAAKATLDPKPITERLEKLAADLDARADEIEKVPHPRRVTMAATVTVCRSWTGQDLEVCPPAHCQTTSSGIRARTSSCMVLLAPPIMLSGFDGTP